MNATLISLSAKLAQATSENDVLSVQNQLTELLIKKMESQVSETVDYLRFTEREIRKAEKTVKNELINHGCVVRAVKRHRSALNFIYELVYRRNGYDLFVTATSLVSAKRLFRRKLKYYVPMGEEQGYDD